MTVKKLIIDTDTGIDDAMALLMALDSHKENTYSNKIFWKKKLTGFVQFTIFRKYEYA